MKVPLRFAALAVLFCSLLLLPLALFGCKSSTAASGSKKSASSASSAASSSSAEKPSSFSLPVSLTKSLNPLTTDSLVNVSLWPLLYDSLAQPDSHYSPVLELASSIDNSGTTVTAHLKSGVKFSDGSSLAAKDVVYSYNLVKATPASFFANNVSNITSVYAVNASTVQFTLGTPDALVQNLLDIPIVKSDTANGASAPVGTGKYTFSTDSMNGTLSANKNWYGSTQPLFQTIQLVNILNSSSILSSLKIREINYLYTDTGSGGSTTVGLDTQSVNLNRMVFVGINAAHGALSDAHVRHALSLSVDRSSLVTDTFSSKALAASLPFNPDWSAAPKTAASSLAASSDSAVSELSADGFTSKDASGALVKSGVSLSFTLLVNKDNSAMLAAARKLQTWFLKTGIVLKLDEEPAQTVSQKYTQGDFDLFIGEIGLNDDMDLSPLLAAGGAASAGIPANSATLTAFNAWRAGTGSLDSLASAFTAETPFIPLCYKTGAVSYTPGLSGTITPMGMNVFLGEETWHY